MKKKNVWSFAEAKFQAKRRSLLAIIVLAAIIGFSMSGCDNAAKDKPITGNGEETVVGSYDAYAPCAVLSNLSSSVNYQIVNLPGESRTNVMKVTKPGGQAAALYDLAAYKGKDIFIEFSVDVKRVGAEGTLNWQVNNNPEFPSVDKITIAQSDVWYTMGSSWTGTLVTQYPSFYLSTYENNSDNTTYYIDNFSIDVKLVTAEQDGGDPRPASPETMSGKTAMQFFADIKAGWNLGNTLDAVSVPAKATETAWGNSPATQKLFDGVKESGFDIVRIPCTWFGHIGPAPDYTIDEARLKRVAQVVGYAKTAGIKAMIINIHHDGNYTQPEKGTWGFVDFAGAVNNPAKKTEIENQISKVWTQIAKYFENYGDYLIFETLNEVHSGNWGNGASNNEQDILFDWNQAALSAIRAAGGNNAARFVAVPGLGGTEPDVAVAANDRNKLLPNDGINGTDKLIVSIHYYAPPQYTVAGITDPYPLIHTWGSQAQINSLIHEMALLKTNFIDNGVAVYIGEWGAPTNVRSSMNKTVKDTHLNYIKSVATTARVNGVLPIYWDDGGDFKMLERSNGKPKTGLWKDVLDTMMDAINNPTPLIPGGDPTPNTITGNLGQYRFGFQEDGVSTNYTQAVWELTGANLTTAKQSGAQLVLALNAAPTATMQLVWQGPTNEIWWEQADILGNTGNVLNASNTTWNAGIKTLTIKLATALADYNTFTVQPTLNIIVAYYGGDSINDLGIVSANLVTP
ncbi:MAG: glycoside hydrolase family 5 protein [Treponema sp.]|jgi:endoglucanase|nr:glycoside hydrolase family 5 protein [Treponema sp.]